MDGISPLYQLLGVGGLSSVIIALVTIFSSRKVIKADAGSKIVESATDLSDRLTAEAVEAKREAATALVALRKQNRRIEVHEVYDRKMKRAAEECPSPHVEIPRPPLFPDEE